jgi:hypothetical protein
MDLYAARIFSRSILVGVWRWVCKYSVIRQSIDGWACVVIFVNLYFECAHVFVDFAYTAR